MLALSVLLFSQLGVRYAEAKVIYHMDSYHILGVFLMIAIAIAGFAILLALHTRETLALRK
ncbi:MAG: hypothetical protein ACREA4_01060 [Nitrososphaera sp.]